jgi:hypothetical protein
LLTSLAYCNLKIDLTVTTALATTGYFKVKFPKWNPGTQRVSKATSMIHYSTSDTVSNGRYKIDCTSTSHPNLACWFLPVTPSSVSAIATAFDELYVSGFSTAISSTLSLTISNSRFRNPSSTKPLTTLTVESYNSNNFMIDQQKSVASY